MPDIHILREHDLGLAKARKVALQWAEDAEQKFEMECTLVEGQTSDTLEFSRTGVKGALRVEADRFTLDAKLGFLLGAFSKTIEAEIEKNLDALLSKSKPGDEEGGAEEVSGRRGCRPYLSDSIRSMYSAIAAALSLPFSAFHASHLARPTSSA